MSKKHFIAIAADIRAQYELCETEAERWRVEFLARRLAHTFAGFNSNFNRRLFLTACGM